MENKAAHLSNVKRIIENAQGWRGVQPALDEIDRSYLLTPKALFPKPVTNPNGTAVLTHINDRASKGDPAEMRKLAYEYLAMADHLEQVEKSKEAEKLNRQRFEAYQLLFPYQNIHELDTFDYARLNIKESERYAIDEIVRLKSQIDNR